MEVNNKPTQLGFAGTTAVAINIVLGLVLVWNFAQLIDIHAGVEQAIRGSIISDNPAEFIRQIRENDVQGWMWTTNVFGLLATAGLLTLLLIPRFNHLRRPAAIWTFVWLGICVVFLLINVIRTVIAFNQLFA